MTHCSWGRKSVLVALTLTSVALTGCSPNEGNSTGETSQSAVTETQGEFQYKAAKDVRTKLEDNGIDCLDEEERNERRQSLAKCESHTLIVVSADAQTSELYAKKYSKDGNNVLTGDNWFVMQNNGKDRLENYKKVLGGQIVQPSE